MGASLRDNGFNELSKAPATERLSGSLAYLHGITARV